jgi:geranylgeranyl diphosphate synthase type I
MKKTEWDPLFHEHALRVINNLQSDELSSTFSDYIQFLNDKIQSMPDWQIALPVIACLAAGGSVNDGIVPASAWVSLNLASEILDNVEDKELTTDHFLTSPEVASNFATGLILASFHALTSIKDAGKARQIVKIFSGSAFDAVYGQHRDLLQNQLPVELFLNNYWEIIILKSGSVFRAATQGGAAAAGGTETIEEALGDYGTALGVILQLIDDCRDAFSHSQDAINWEISLPLLLYLMTVGEENIIFPAVSSRAGWSNLLQKTGVIQTISALLLQWESRALESLNPLPQSPEKHILERIPSLFLQRIPSTNDEVIDEHNI